MARPLRIEFPGAWYHVMNRGAGRKAIFLNDGDRVQFLKVVDDVVDTYRLEVHAYCLMNTHYHLLVRTPRGNLARAMRHLNGVYTQRFNRARRLDGPLFRGRYKAILIDADSHLAQVSRYIHLNPVEAKIVRDPADCRWSSYRYFVGKEAAPRWLNTTLTLELFGKTDKAAGLYRDFLMQGVDEKTKQFYGKRRQEPILGGDDFREKVGGGTAGSNPDKEIAERKYLQKRLTVEEIIEFVAEGFTTTPEALLKDGRGRRGEGLPRIVGMALSRRPGGHSLGEIGRVFGSSYSGVSVAERRLAEKISKDGDLSERIRSIVSSAFSGLEYKVKT